MSRRFEDAPWRCRGRLPLITASGLMVALLAPGLTSVNGQTAAALSAGAFPLLATEPDATDAQQRYIMPMTVNLPWGAVGFLDNGCTGTLIDSQHVLAASHCFTFDDNGQTVSLIPYLQGAWQTGLVFFPNYHPARANPPRYAIDRVVVGSRVQTDPAGPAVAADWGIGHLATPVTGFPALPLEPMPRWRYPDFIAFAGYARDPATYPAGRASYPQPAPGGYCANFWFNCWWIPAFVDPRCLALDEVDGIVPLNEHSCLIQGGNSGSSVIWDAGSPGTPALRVTGVISGPRAFWSASRFQYAPRYAAGVAIAPHDDGTQRTQVLATDSDLGRIVSRSRSDRSVSGPFTYFRDLGSIPSPGPMAAFRLRNGRPQVVVVSGNGALYTSLVTASGQWLPWHPLAGPAGVTGFLDIAAAYGALGLPQLYVIGSDHNLYTSRASTASAIASWLPWVKLSVGAQVQRVAVARHGDGRQQAFVISTAGTLLSLWQTSLSAGSAWSQPVVFGGGPFSPLSDVAAAWTPDGRVQIFALYATGSAFTRQATRWSPLANFGPWATWSVPLYAPRATMPPQLDGVVSLTAGRWLEGGPSTVPVVLATDQQGNIYVTSYVNGQWQPWRSFYN